MRAAGGMRPGAGRLGTLRVLLRALGMVSALAPCAVMAPSDGEPASFDAMSRAIDEGRYEEGAQIGRRLLARLEEEGSGDSLEATDVIDRLVFTLIRSGRAAAPETLDLATRGFAIREKRFGPDDPGLARGLDMLANVHYRAGAYAAARSHYERALAILNANPGDDERTLPGVCMNFGNLLADTGDYAGARDLYERAIAILEARAPADGIELGLPFHLLGLVLTDLGDLDASRAALERALGIYEKVRGPDHPDVANALDGLAAAAAAAGDDSRARRLWSRALRIVETKLGRDHMRAAGVLTNLGDVLLRAGRLDAALAAQERAVRIWESVFGPEHPAVAHALTGLGDVHLARSEYEIARQNYERALAIRVAKLGTEHPRTATSHIKLARSRWSLGERLAALEGALQGQGILDRQVRRMARRLSEREALEYQKIESSGLDLAWTVLASATGTEGDGGAWTARAWSALIRARGRILDEMLIRNRTLLERRSPEVARMHEDLESAQADLAALLIAGPAGRPDFRDRLVASRERIDRAEKALADLSLEFRHERDRSAAGFAEAARELPRGFGLLAFSRYNHVTEGGVEAPSYLAYVLPSSADPPRAIRLGPAAEIDARIASWRRESSTLPSEEAAVGRYRAAGERLREVLWDPIAAFLTGARHVLIVPDGDIHLVNFSTLPVGRDRYLLESGPTLHYLTAERDLVEMRSDRPAGAGLLAMGGADFDRPPVPVAEASAQSDPQPGPAGAAATSIATAVYRGTRPPCVDTGPRFAPLPGSRSEAAEVASMWRSRNPASPRDPVLLLTERQAGEGAFKHFAPGRRIVHLATHAEWLGADCDPERLARSPASRIQVAGLAFAGANRRHAAGENPDGEDGILTAEEVAALDLRQVEWVVLSGCDTGVGPVARGEGVLGLRRAFTLAGARTLLISLWPVTDHDAREWIGEVYRARLGGASTSGAVREGSLAILDARRRAGAITHPFFWGAFVAAGDWK